MNIAKRCLIGSLFILFHFPAYAQQAPSLPSIQLMADKELRNESVTTVTPFLEDDTVRESLQHQQYKKEKEIQNYKPEYYAAEARINPPSLAPDMSQLTPSQLEFVMGVVGGFQSSDPTNGILKMLEPLGIDRERGLDGVRSGMLPINFNESQMTKLFGENWRNQLRQN